MEQFGNPNIVKQLHLGNDGRDKVIEGVRKLNTAVSSTLGASGRNVLIEDQFGNVQSTKDGVSVASYVNLKDPVENMGATLLKQAAAQTAQRAGDGTTTSTLLATSIINKYFELEGDKSPFRVVKDGIETTVASVVESLEKKSKKITPELLEHVSIISSNNDQDLGKLIASAFEEAGENGVVTVGNSPDETTYVKTVEGTHINETCQRPHFFTNPTKEVCELEKPLIFLSSQTITNIRDIESILQYSMQAKRPLILVADLEQQPMSALAMNNLKGIIKVNVVSPPDFGLKQKDILDDIALLTGSKVLDNELGDTIDRITPDLLGSADKSISDREGTTFIVSPEQDKVDARVKELSDALEGESHNVLKSHLERRLALLTGGISQIYVGGSTEVELNERKDRVDDAVSAVRAAKKSGILPGGGSALHYIAKNITDECIGSYILKEALFEPFNHILTNSNLDPMNKDYNIKKWGTGVNAITGEVVDMIDEGIIDPTLVTTEALKNAASVALTVLSTDVIISNERLSE